MSVLLVSLLLLVVLVLVLQTGPQAQGNGQVGRYQGVALMMPEDDWPTVLLVDTTNGKIWKNYAGADQWEAWAPPAP
ncbi:MAG: hypothetical protein GX100_06030 [candidate division WS1 bacterium]|nr:hypothetical protein [candidate division WS1 bacterium]